MTGSRKKEGKKNKVIPRESPPPPPPVLHRSTQSKAYPNVELDVLVDNGLDIESNSGDGGHRLVELELVQNG